MGLEPAGARCVIVLGSDAATPVHRLVGHINDAYDGRPADIRHTTCQAEDVTIDYSVLRRLLGLSPSADADAEWPSATRPKVLVVGEAQWCDRGTLRWIDRVMNRADDQSPTVLMTLSHRALTTADAAFHEIMSRDYCTVADAADFLATRAAGPDLAGLAAHEPHLLRVVQAAAVLRGTDTDLVSALTGLPLRVVARALEDARGLGLVREPTPTSAGVPDRVEAVAVEAVAALSDPEVERMHARAAEILSDAARPAEQVADHLLERSALDSPWMVSILREAAAATRHDYPAAAVRYLSRLHSINGNDDTTLVELGTALLEIDPARAREHLERALSRIDVAGTGHQGAAVPGALAAEAAAALRLASLMTGRISDAPKALGALLHEIRDDATSRMLVPAAQALSTALGGSGMDVAVNQAERVLAAERRPGVWATVAAARAIHLADRTESALNHLANAAADARRREEPWAECHAKSARAMMLLESGALVDAAAEAAGALRIAERRGWTAQTRLPLTTLTIVMLCRDDLERAEQLLRRIDEGRLDQPDQVGGRSVWEHHYGLMARALVHRGRGRLQEALVLMESCGASLDAEGVHNPLFTAWWLYSAELLVRLGREDAARERAESARRAAQRWPTPRSIGLSLMADSFVATPADRAVLLAESARALADSSDGINHSRAEHRLGRALFALGDKRGARTHLGAARRLAEEHGLLIVAEHAGSLLSVAGGRAERGARSAPNVLSAAELPVAELAAAGATNRDIADTLFLTVRTVEYHLTNVYRKLGVAGRADLADRLAPDAADSGAQ